MRDAQYGEEQRVAIAYVDRPANEADFAALESVHDAEERVLVAPEKTRSTSNVRATRFSLNSSNSTAIYLRSSTRT